MFVLDIDLKRDFKDRNSPYYFTTLHISFELIAYIYSTITRKRPWYSGRSSQIN